MLRNKIGIFTLIILLVSNQMLTTFGLSEVTEPSQNENIVHDVTLFDELGQTIDENMNNRFSQDSSINVGISWALTNLKKENHYTYTLPNEIKIEEEQKGNLEMEGKKIGTFHVNTNGIINFQTDLAENEASAIKGTFNIMAGLGSDKVAEIEELPITFKLNNGSKTIIVPVEAGESNVKNEKEEHGSKNKGSKKDSQKQDVPQAKAIDQERDAKENVKKKTETEGKGETLKSKGTFKKVSLMNDTTDTTITQSYVNKNSNGSDKIQYYVGEDIVYQVGLTISGNVTSLTNHVVKIEMPGEHVDNNWSLTKPETASTVEYKTENGKKIAYITFPTLAGGTEINFPVRLKFNGRSTGSLVPEGYELKIDAAILDEEDNVVKQANQIVFEAKYDKPSLEKRLQQRSNNGQTIYGGHVENGEIRADATVEIPFDFRLKNVSNRQEYRAFNKVTITDTLPPYASFNPVLNPGWELSTDGKTVSKEYEATNNTELSDKVKDDKLWLTFPGAKVNETYSNKTEAIFEQKDKQSYEPEYTADSEITYVFSDDVKGEFLRKNALTDGSNIYDSKLGKEKLQRWSIIISNPTGMEMRDIVIDDYELDERMKFEYVETLNLNYFKDSNVEIIAIVGPNKTEQTLTEIDGKYTFPADTRSFKVKIDKLSPYTSTQTIHFNTSIKDPDNVHYDNDDTDNNLFFNYAQMDADLVIPSSPENKVKINPKVNDRYTLVQIDETVRISKQLWSSKSQYLEGDEVEFRLNFIPSADVQADRVFKNAKFIDLLPNGLTPIESSNYTIVENFKNSGRTAIIFELGDLQGNNSRRPNFKATVNKHSDEGFNTNETYFIYEGEQLPISGDNKGPDKLDLYEDGDLEKEINYATVDYNYLPPKEVVSTKYIRTNDSNYWTSTGITTPLGESFEYRLGVKNYLDNDVKNLMIYDVFPHSGDRAIVKNHMGERVERGSTFANTLTGPIVASDGFTVYYTTQQMPANEAEAVDDSSWQETVSDYSQVTAIKIVMNDGKVLKSKESADFIVPMIAPSNWGLQPKDIAYNSFASSTNNGASFVEANKVFNNIDTPELITKNVEGDVHLDIDREQEFNYNVITQLPDDIEDYEKFVITDDVDPGLSVIENGVKATVDGQSFNGLDINVAGNKVTVTVTDFAGLTGKQQIELVIPTKINMDTNINDYVDGNIPNTANVVFKHENEPDGYMETDPVTVTPEDPDIVKDVNGTDHINIDRNQEYQYNIKTPLPKDIAEYRKFIITDDVDSGLSVIDSAVKATVDGEDYAGLVVAVNGNKVTVTVNDFAGLSGKNQIELTIPAKIKQDTDISNYVDEKIPNTAILDFTNTSDENKRKETDPVTVTPPPTPKLEKDVEGKEHLEIEKEKEYKYNVTTEIPEDLGGYESLTLSDTLDPRLEIVKADVLVEGVASNFVATINNQTATLTLDRDMLDTIAGKEVNLQITSKIRFGVEIELIENKATIQLNNNPEVESNPVTVIPPEPPTPEIEKDVEGQEHLEIAKEKEYKYNVTTEIPEDLGGYESLTLSDTLDPRLEIVKADVLVDGVASSFAATINNQTATLTLDRDMLDTIAGKEVNLQITSKIRFGVEIELIENKATIQLNNNPEVESNPVTVIPPEPPTPEIEKDVEGQEHLDIDRNKEYIYNVKTNIPEDIGGYKDLIITDKLDERLTVLGAEVFIDDILEMDLKADIRDQLVTLSLDRNQLDEITGKEINLQITAMINGDVDVETIDNKATIELNDNPGRDSNIVTVTPPEPETPGIEKDVEGEDFLNIDRKKPYKYNVKTNIPEDVGGYKDLVITDELDERLTVLGAEVFIDDILETDLRADIRDQLVTLSLDRNQLDKITGKEINLQITAMINGDVDVETIDNKATIQLNDNPGEDSNVVTVTPPEPEDPTIAKDVEGQDHIDVNYDETYNYNIITTVPKGIEDYSHFVITDVVDDGLAIEDVMVTVDGDSYAGIDVLIDGQSITAEVIHFIGLEDKEQIELIITAKVRPDTDINEYIDHKIPNTAKLDFTNAQGRDGRIKTYPVTVTPPTPKTPTISKDVEGKKHLDIERDKEYVYNVKTNIPKDIGGYKDLVITDQLDDRLTVVSVKVLVDGKVSDLKATIDGQKVTLQLNREQLETLAGKEINIQITAKINSDVKVVTIDNKATMQLNNYPTIDSNVVTVTPPPVTVPDKPEGKDKLPKTATHLFNLLSLGFALLLVGFVLLKFKTRKNA